MHFEGARPSASWYDVFASVAAEAAQAYVELTLIRGALPPVFYQRLTP
jgi:hypothetical protein